jgi:glycosyltransferase involved in cell wall biosynthesis
MKKLIIQIPCYNEEEAVGITLTSLPREISGIHTIEWLIIDDGSTDATVDVALAHGVHHIIRLPRNQGLGKAFAAGLEACVERGADLIVNVDADNQYHAEDIPKLIQPILNGEAEIVIGTRPVSTIREFSLSKRILQRLGSWVVRIASKTKVADAPSGFRAMTRDAAIQLNVFNPYTYTLETIIQAGQKNMSVVSVPVRTNPALRKSRLIHSVPEYLSRSALTIVRIFMTYRPFRFFVTPGLLLFFSGFALGIRFLYFYISAGGAGHVQSLILAALLMGMGFFLVVIGLIADLIAVNRQLLEKIDKRIQKIESRMRETFPL